MYNNRSPEWWNYRGDCFELVSDPLIILSFSGLRGTRKNWNEQNKELKERAFAGSADRVAMAGATPLDWMMADACARILGDNDLDRATVTRFVQHEQDRSGGGTYGPVATVFNRRMARLGDASSGRESDEGFRLVTGARRQD